MYMDKKVVRRWGVKLHLHSPCWVFRTVVLAGGDPVPIVPVVFLHVKVLIYCKQLSTALMHARRELTVQRP